jgi:hypothetical protein
MISKARKIQPTCRPHDSGIQTNPTFFNNVEKEHKITILEFQTWIGLNASIGWPAIAVSFALSWRVGTHCAFHCTQDLSTRRPQTLRDTNESDVLHLR